MKLDWNKLSARERDALVATGVMGWEWLERSNREQGQYVWRKAIFPPEGEEWIRWNFNPHKWRKASAETPLFSDWDRCSGQRDDDRKLGSRRIMGLPPFTTEIQFAWLVVERMRGKLYSKSHKFVDLLPIIIGARIGLVGLMHPSEVLLHVTPDDICLAACRAEGVEV